MKRVFMREILLGWEKEKIIGLYAKEGWKAVKKEIGRKFKGYKQFNIFQDWGKEKSDKIFYLSRIQVHRFAADYVLKTELEVAEKDLLNFISKELKAKND